MFSRSIDQYGIKYTRYTRFIEFKSVRCACTKTRMLLTYKKEWERDAAISKKRTKGLGGRSKNTVKLTDKVINKLQKYYGLAITRHQDNVDEMYKETWATLHHFSSTDENLNHGNCAAGANSWCSYRRAEAEGMDLSKLMIENDYLPLDKDITKALEPIFTDLSSR